MEAAWPQEPWENGHQLTYSGGSEWGNGTCFSGLQSEVCLCIGGSERE